MISEQLWEYPSGYQVFRLNGQLKETKSESYCFCLFFQALREAGVIGGGDMTPEAALTKLCYVLGKDQWTLDHKRRVRVYGPFLFLSYILIKHDLIFLYFSA